MRDTVVGLLSRPNTDLADAGCLLYEVGVNHDHPDVVFVSELWTSRDAHQASLLLPSVQASIARALPLMNGESTGHSFEVSGSPLR